MTEAGRAMRPAMSRLASVALVSVALATGGASAASAASLRQGTTAAYPTFSSALVASGSAAGGPLAGSATFATPVGVGSCLGGALRTTVGANPAGSISLSTGTSPNSLQLDSCADNIPNWTLNRVLLANAPTLTAVSASGGGTLTFPSTVRFDLIFNDGGGTLTPCQVAPVGPSPAVGSLNNGNARVTFSNVRVRATATTGLCATNLGTSSTGTTGNTVLSFTFGPLRTVPTAGTGNLLGLFA